MFTSRLLTFYTDCQFWLPEISKNIHTEVTSHSSFRFTLVLCCKAQGYSTALNLRLSFPWTEWFPFYFDNLTSCLLYSSPILYKISIWLVNSWFLWKIKIVGTCTPKRKFFQCSFFCKSRYKLKNFQTKFWNAIALFAL